MTASPASPSPGTLRTSGRPASEPALGLGLDVGGSQARWALAEAGTGTLVAEGHGPGFSGMQLSSEAGRAELVQALQRLAAEVLVNGRPARVRAGITGLAAAEPGDAPGVLQMQALMARALRLPTDAIDCRSDIDIAWRAAFDTPGQGYLLYAGTGSVAAFIDADGRLQRAGGRGGLLGDEGSGFWIAREALAQVWRLEDEAPGSAAARSPMARRLFDAIGSSDWAATRALVYGGPRGRVGQLALAVAAAADEDPEAAALLYRAGTELARLALCLIHRFGPRPLVATGRAWLLSPRIEQGLRDTLTPAAPGTALCLQQSHPHRSAALQAAASINDRPA